MTGMSCNTQHQVVSLFLYNNPTAPFDPLLWNLTSLAFVLLVQVGISGWITAPISSLTSLQSLHSSNKSHAGSLSPFLSLLVSLLDSDRLTGPIPQHLDTLPLLGMLQLSYNNLKSTLPVSLYSLTVLAYLYAALNLHEGPIPPQYSALQRLPVLSQYINRLNGKIASQLTSIGHSILSVNNNPAMCSPSLDYPLPASTHIGKDYI